MRSARIRTLAVLCTSLALVAPAAAGAQALVTDVIDAADDDDPFDANIEVRYEFQTTSARIARELPCYAPSSACPDTSRVILASELDYEEILHQMVIAPRIGLYKDLDLTFELPIVLLQQTKLSFAPGVGLQNSSVISKGASAGLFAMPFNGPQRSGFGDMRIGLRYSPLNYARDETEPTWVIGLTYTAPTGKVREGGSEGVGLGLHALELYTTISRRALDWFEPYFNFHGTFRFPAASTLFDDLGTTQTLVKPGNSLGIMLGLELIPWEDRDADARVELDLGFSADYTFEGREYSELFEALAASPCNADPNCALTRYTRDVRANVPTAQAGRSNGITDVEDYGIFKTWLGLHYQPVKYFQLGARFTYTRRTDHFITNGDPGTDLDGDGEVTSTGLAGNEYSPVYIEGIDAPAGDRHTGAAPTRFRSQSSNAFGFMVHLTGKF
jgi:hypothetical protein